MSLTIPDEILFATRMSEEEMRQEIAVLLFQKNKLTLGKASEMAGLTREQFQNLIASRNIPIHYTVADLKQDIDSLSHLH